MKAAVLHTVGQPPRFEDFPDPHPGENEVRVHIKAASLKNIDKAIASGSHYSSHSPLICAKKDLALTCSSRSTTIPPRVNPRKEAIE